MATKAHDPRQTWAIDPDAPPGSFAAKMPFVDNGCGPISPNRYYSSEWMERERERLWPRVWNWAARAEDLVEPGDFETFEIGRDSILMVRDHDMRLRAFHNVCPHRGNRLVSQPHGSLPSAITCPFHNWGFDFSGRNIRVTDRETFRAEALARDFDLAEVRCETWEGFVFINMDMGADPLLDHVGVLAEHAKPYRIADMRIMRRVQAVWDANWKVGLDGFNEAYHVHAIHPQILGIFNDYHAQIDCYPNGMTRMTTKFAHSSPRLPDGTLHTDLVWALEDAGLDPARFDGRMQEARPAVQRAKRARASALGLDWSGFSDNQLTDDWNYHLFPNMHMGLHPEGISLLYFRPHPHDPRRFIFDVIVMMHPSDDPAIKPPAYMGLPDGTDISGRERVETVHVDWREGGLGEIFDQDSRLFREVQLGIESRGYRGAILSEQEQRIGHFHAELERWLGFGA
jgi:phenylpropionate dioxygenase-like ring-hydroxylating dioxygenase large terminal subunit